VNETPEERRAAVDEALRNLSKGLATGKVSVKVGANGAIAFVGAWERNRMTDVCAYRTLMARGSMELRTAVARAEQIAGRKVSLASVVAGIHSHDGGKTWHPGH